METASHKKPMQLYFACLIMESKSVTMDESYEGSRSELTQHFLC